MRKATTLFLLLVFFANGMGYLNVYRFMVDKKSPAHKNRLKQQNMLRVSTTRGQSELLQKGFKRMEQGEYTFKGRWYDVVGQQQKGDSTIISLAHDSYEEELLTFLKAFFGKSTADSQTCTAKLTHDILRQYLITPNPFIALHFKGEQLLKEGVFSMPPVPFLEVISPPPKSVA